MTYASRTLTVQPASPALTSKYSLFDQNLPNSNSTPLTGFGAMNFSGLKNSFYLTFLISTLIDLTRVVSEVSLTGGGNASIIYFISQTLIFAFVLRSIFIGILYDIIVNKVDEVVSDSQISDFRGDVDSSYIKTSRNSPSPLKRSLVPQPIRGNSRRNLEEAPDALVSPALFSENSPAKSPSSPLDFSAIVKHAIQKNKIDITEKSSMSTFKKFLVDKYNVSSQSPR